MTISEEETMSKAVVGIVVEEEISMVVVEIEAVGQEEGEEIGEEEEDKERRIGK